MSSAASRLIRFGNNASHQNLIQRNLLHPSAAATFGASVTHLLSTVTEPRLPSQFDAANPTLYFNTLPVQRASCNASDIVKKYYSDRDVSMIMFGQSVVDQPGNIKIHARRRSRFDDDNDGDPYLYPKSDADSGNEAFGEHDDDFSDGDLDDSDDDYDGDDFDENSIRKSKF